MKKHLMIFIVVVLMMVLFIYLEFSSLEKQVLYGTSLRYFSEDKSELFISSERARELAKGAGIKIVRVGWNYDPEILKQVCLIIHSIGAKPIVQLPYMGSDYVQKATAIVSHLGSLCDLYEVGNEPNNFQNNISPERYAEIYREVVAECRKINNNALYGGPVVGPIGGWANSTGFIQVWLDKCKDLLHKDDTFFSYHWYTTSYLNVNNGKYSKNDLIERAKMYKNYTIELRELCVEKLGYELPIAVTEFNWCTNTNLLDPDKHWQELDEEFITTWTITAMNSIKEGGAWMILIWRYEGGNGLINFDGNTKFQYFAFKEFALR